MSLKPEESRQFRISRIGEINRLRLGNTADGSIVGDMTDFISLGWILAKRSRDMHWSSESRNKDFSTVGLLDFLSKPLEHLLPIAEKPQATFGSPGAM